MGTWNYRIIDFGTHLALHEVHYDQAGTLRAYTEEAITFVCDPEEGREGISGALAMAHKDARDEPILKPTDFPGASEALPDGPIKTKPFDAAAYLKSEEEVVIYLLEALEGGDRAHIEGAVRDAVRALKALP